MLRFLYRFLPVKKPRALLYTRRIPAEEQLKAQLDDEYFLCCEISRDLHLHAGCNQPVEVRGAI